jgi:hypothetical protein
VLRGIGLFLGTPGVRLLGIVPVLLAALVVLSLLGLLVVYLDELAETLTPFADRWDESSRTLVRVGAGLALLLGSTVVLVVSFTVIAQIIGQPFYERISDRIEHQLGAPPAGADAPWWRTFPRASLESALLLAMTCSSSGCSRCSARPWCRSSRPWWPGSSWPWSCWPSRWSGAACTWPGGCGSCGGTAPRPSASGSPPSCCSWSR